MNCYELRRFNADIMKVYISALGHARNIKLSSYIHLSSVNQIYQNPHARVIFCNVGEAYILGAWARSALEHARMLIILSDSVLVASINTICKYCYA